MLSRFEPCFSAALPVCQQMHPEENGGRMGTEQAMLLGIQNRIVRLVQAASGKYACYATPSNGECGNKECVLRKDCFDAARELFPPLRMPEQGMTEAPVIAAMMMPAQAGDRQGADKPTNGKHANWECPLRNTCKLPTDYCSKGRCEDWFF